MTSKEAIIAYFSIKQPESNKFTQKFYNGVLNMFCDPYSTDRKPEEDDINNSLSPDLLFNPRVSGAHVSINEDYKGYRVNTTRVTFRMLYPHLLKIAFNTAPAGSVDSNFKNLFNTLLEEYMNKNIQSPVFYENAIVFLNMTYGWINKQYNHNLDEKNVFVNTNLILNIFSYNFRKLLIDNEFTSNSSETISICGDVKKIQNYVMIDLDTVWFDNDNYNGAYEKYIGLINLDIPYYVDRNVDLLMSKKYHYVEINNETNVTKVHGWGKKK